jgi:general secretion pathway protein G
MKKTTLHKSAGFTLIEMLVVMAILGMLVALVGPSIWNNLGRGQRSAAAAQIANLQQALDTYLLDNGRYPQSLDGLIENDTGRDSWQGPYLGRTTSVPNDPWGNPYVYELDGKNISLISWGADGAPGGTGDDADIGE